MTLQAAASGAGLDTVRLAIAGLIGLAAGIEREWSGHASGPSAHFAGVRTFLMFGLLGGACGLLLAWSYAAAAVALLSGGAAFVAIAYYITARRDGADVDGTTEGAALLVLALGAFAGLGHTSLAAGTATLVVLALREKEGLHSLVRHIGQTEMRATLQFAVLALVVLPLLPAGPFGPFGGIRPRELWGVVLVLAGLNFAGYLARKSVGATRGYTLTGMLGGVVSSTAVALQFARTSRRVHEDGDALARGVTAACTVLIPRVVIVAYVLNAPVARALIPYLLAPFLAGTLMTLSALRASRGAPSETREEQNPLALGSALKMAALFQLSITVVTVVNQFFGSAGVLATSAVMGATDMDALTISMTRLAETSQIATLAARGLAIGVFSNTLFKLTIVIVMGYGSFRRYAGAALAVLAAASAIGWWLAPAFY